MGPRSKNAFFARILPRAVCFSLRKHLKLEEELQDEASSLFFQSKTPPPSVYLGRHWRHSRDEMDRPSPSVLHTGVSDVCEAKNVSLLVQNKKCRCVMCSFEHGLPLCLHVPRKTLKSFMWQNGPGLSPSLLHTTSDEKLDSGEACERGYSYSIHLLYLEYSYQEYWYLIGQYQVTKSHRDSRESIYDRYFPWG